MSNSRNARNTFNKLSIFGNDHQFFCLLENKQHLLPFKKTPKDPMNSESQSQKGILATNFAKRRTLNF